MKNATPITLDIVAGPAAKVTLPEYGATGPVIVWLPAEEVMVGDRLDSGHGEVYEVVERERASQRKVRLGLRKDGESEVKWVYYLNDNRVTRIAG
jgi:hypothetical protein